MSRRDERRERLLTAMPGVTETPVRAGVLAERTGLSVGQINLLLARLTAEGRVTSRLETDAEVRPGALRGTRYRLTPGGAWERAGLT